MELSNDSLPVRKAYSAENSKDETSELSYEWSNKSSKTCASASYLSARRKFMQERHLQNLLSNDFFANYIKPNSKEKQKLFLTSSQILEKLSKTVNKFSAAFQRNETVEISAAQTKRASFREIVLYQEALKRLLEERCILVLKEECDICIKKTIKLINDFKHVYVNEKLKMTTMPIQACNRFISSDDINVSTLELLMKKLQIIFDLHLSIGSSYQKIINCFHVSLDLELYQTVLKTNRLLQKYKSSLFHWGYKCMSILMQKLCLVDPNSVSPEFLCTFLESSQVFNTLLKNNKGFRHCCQTRYDLFYKHVSSTECKEVPFSLILTYLAYFEAKVASDRVVHFLMSTCKKNRQTDLKRNMLEKPTKIDCGTSDYHSATISDIDSELSSSRTKDFANTCVNFSNLLVSITQRNQSLVLKYVYAATNLSNSFNRIKPRLSCEINSSITAVRQLWNVPEQNSHNSNYILLEETFWLNFWDNVQRFILKILYEVPHQYGDTKNGTILLWPEVYVDTFLECLKLCATNEDLTDEGKYAIKKIYEHILIYKIHTLWDKEFLLTLSSIFSHRCTLVPTSTKQIKTLTGSLFHVCLDVLLGVFNLDIKNMDLLLFLQCLHQLHSTLDSFILWISSRTRAVFASQNLSTYLIIIWSDCKSASKLLQTKTAVLVQNTDSFLRFPALRFLKEKILWKQIDILRGYLTEAPHLVYNFCFCLIRDDLLLAVQEQAGNNCSYFRQKSFRLDATEELLFSLTEVVNLPDPMPVITSISTSVAQAFLFILHHLKKAINTKLINFLQSEIFKFCEWLDKLDLSQDEKLKLTNLHCLKKVKAILKYIQIPVSRSKTFSYRQNRIEPIAVTETQMSEDVLTDQEKQYWQSVLSRNLLCSCF